MNLGSVWPSKYIAYLDEDRRTRAPHRATSCDRSAARYLPRAHGIRTGVSCPYAAVWQEFGPEGLALGQLYDVELHTTLCSTYHPGVVVRWEELKTWGDAVCKFRFSIPELAGPDEPAFQPKPPGLHRLPR